MSRSHYFYFPLSVAQLEKVVKDHQDAFESLVGDSFSDEELEIHEKKLDAIAAVYAQPILSELTFDDFYPDENCGDLQKEFFSKCLSSIAVENLPYFESNPFQVTYLKELLNRFSEVLIDRGGIQELQFKQQYLEGLNQYPDMDTLLAPIAVPTPAAKASAPVDPIDFLVRDVYREFDRLRASGTLLKAIQELAGQPEKLKVIFFIMREQVLGAPEIFQKSGLIPKDFDDQLERLKFFLKKI